MNKTEYIGKLNALYVGEKNCLEELITAYDEKDKEIERLNNIINEVREYIEENTKSDSSIELTSGKITDIGYCIVAFEDILEILDKGDDEISK